MKLLAFLAGAAIGAFFTWLILGMLLVDRALNQNHEDA